MPEEAHRFTVNSSADLTGLDDFFPSHDKSGHEDLTLEEAAKRLNISERTVQRRIKQGRLVGYKVNGDRGPEWRIRIQPSEDTTSDNVPTSEDTTIIDAVATSSNVLSSEDMTDDTKVMAKAAYLQFTEFYQEQIGNLQEKLEGATYRNGFLEAKLSTVEDQLKLLPDLSARATKVETLEKQIALLEQELAIHRQGWFSRFLAWFTGKQQ